MAQGTVQYMVKRIYSVDLTQKHKLALLHIYGFEHLRVIRENHV